LLLALFACGCDDNSDDQCPFGILNGQPCAYLHQECKLEMQGYCVCNPQLEWYCSGAIDMQIRKPHDLSVPRSRDQ
jgi:hypothetical protein